MRKSVLSPKLLVALVVLVLAAGAAALASTSGSSSAGTAAKGQFEASGLVSPFRQAPPLALRNYLGQPVNIDSYRGKAVLVTFLYVNCPDICPLITSQLHVALEKMKPAERSKVQIIAVSVDPRGDTPKSVAAFLARHEMTGRMLYLIGSAKELAPVWSAWGVGSEREAQSPQFVNHTGIVYGISGSGRRMTVYAPTFQPGEIVHDVPLLAAR